MNVPSSIFRQYDIRGGVGEELDAQVAHAIGRAVPSGVIWTGFRADRRIDVWRDSGWFSSRSSNRRVALFELAFTPADRGA